MNNKKRIKELEKKVNELKGALNERGRDFIQEYDLLNVKYLEDALSEYADSSISIYYSDIEEYYKTHVQESSDALKEYGFTLYDFNDLEEASYKGAQLAEFDEIYGELAENENILSELTETLKELKQIKEE